jgi:hypothetical protein
MAPGPVIVLNERGSIGRREYEVKKMLDKEGSWLIIYQTVGILRNMGK